MKPSANKIDIPVFQPLEKLQFPANYVTIMERVAAAKGIDSKALIESRLHIKPVQLQQANLLITGQQLWDILDFSYQAAATSLDAQLALIASVPLTAHGYVGLAVMSAPTLEKVVEQMIKWHQLAMPACRMAFETRGDVCQLRFFRTSSFGKYDHLFDELGASVILSMIALANLEFDAVNLDLARPELVLSELGGAYPKLNIATGCEFTEVRFPSSQLSRPIPTANSALLASMQATLEDQDAEFAKNRPLTVVVSSLISNALQNGNPINAGNVSSELKLPLRSLSRRLREEGSSFKALHHRVRIEMARNMLTRTDLNVSQVAELLGFSCDASFSRFFKQRTGRCPTEFNRSSD